MNFTYNIQNISYSFHPNAHNYHCLDWGPNGLLGIAFENFITICDSSNFNVICTFNLHKSNIACIRFSPGSVERSYANSFQSLIAVGDETGNCLIYDIFNGVRHAGFSPEKLPVTPIIDIQWNQSNPSMLFILTAAPSIICVSIGSTSRRHYSCVQSWSQIGQSLQSFNLNYIFSVPLNGKYQFILTDQFHTNQLLVASSTGNYYSLVRLQNGRQQPIATAPLQFNGLPSDQKILSIECFPHNLNRLTIVMDHSIYVYDLIAKTASLIYRHNLSCFSPMSNVFSASISNKFWIAICDGNVTSFTIQGENFVRESYVLIPQFYQMCQFSVDPYKPSRFAVCTTDGKIAIFNEYKSKLICTAYRPSFPNNISSMTSDNDRQYAFVTNQGYIGLFDTFSGIRYRYRIDIEKFEGINFSQNGSNVRYNSIVFAGKNLAVGSNCLFMIDLQNRQISLKNRHLIPTKLMSIGSILACTPFPNTLDIIFPNMPKKSLTFTSTIVAFTSRMADPNRWALIVRGSGICVVDISEKPKMVAQLVTNDEAACSILYIGSLIYVATRIGEVVRINIETKQTVSIKVCGCMIRSMKSFENFILFSDVENNTYLIDTDAPQFRVSRAPKWKIIEGFFIKASITKTAAALNPSAKEESGKNEEEEEIEKVIGNDGKISVKPLSNFNKNDEVVMNDDADERPFRIMVAVQTSLSTLMIVALPSFEICMAPSITSSKTRKYDISSRFLQCSEIEEFEKIALEAGDLDFVQFVRTLRRMDKLPLPALYTQNHVEFVAKERITRLIERETQPYNLVDFLILTNETHSAARMLMQLETGLPLTSFINSSSNVSLSTRIGASKSFGTFAEDSGTIKSPSKSSIDEDEGKSENEGNGGMKKAASAFFLPSIRGRKRLNSESPSIASYESTSITGNANLLFAGVDTFTIEDNAKTAQTKKIGIPFGFGKSNLMESIIGSSSSDFSSPSLTNILGIRDTTSSAVNVQVETDRNESDLLLAYACMAPNLEAAKCLATNFINSKTKGRHIQTIAKLFCISGDRDAAINWLAANNDWASALYYLKILYRDDEDILEYEEEEEKHENIKSNQNLNESIENQNLNDVSENIESSDVSGNLSGENQKSGSISTDNDTNNENTANGKKKKAYNAEKATIEIIRNWLKQKPIQLSPFILIFIGDYHAALSILYKSGSVAKAYVLIKFLRKNNIEIEPSAFTEYISYSVDDIINKIETKWNAFSA
ncbi:WD repeat-containing protein 11 [Tritrichomonas musculus]|uniref:WD repeat-containing protein 11 n=1 Tax=Tritrichomonas musculus TaxID=1915356 RepID=A0ABR2KFP1_9EUKA